MSVKVLLLNSGYSGFEWVQVPAQKCSRGGVHGLISVRHMNLAYRYGECTSTEKGTSLAKVLENWRNIGSAASL